jgi:hypothetical protein
VASYTPGEALFTPALTHLALTARHTAGARITTQASDGGIPQATDLLFRVNPNGTLIPATLSRPPTSSRATPSSSWARAKAERRSNGGRSRSDSKWSRWSS